MNSLCPNCFEDKGTTVICPYCRFNENEWNSPLMLPYRTELGGQYVSGRMLGKPGGFGITYLGWDKQLERRVAIKEYLPRDLASRGNDHLTVVPNSRDDKQNYSYGLEQFLYEARTVVQFDHEHIVRVRNYFEANGTAYLVMEYYEGKTLQEYVNSKGGRISEKAAVGIMIPILDGLREIHAKGYLHRDIKPQNIYITANNRPILLDFGAARQAVGERTSSLSVIMTPGFGPPEQYSRRGQQGPWTDIYGCAATLYWACTGVTPVDAMDRMAQEVLPSPQQFIPGLSPAFAGAIMMGMNLAVNERPQSIGAFQNMLMYCLGQQPSLPIQTPAAEIENSQQQVAAERQNYSQTGSNNNDDQNSGCGCLILIVIFAIMIKGCS